jgi:hypothetical protein
MQFPTVKEYDFDRQFLFDEYVHGHFLSLQFKKSIIDARQPVEFP